MKFSICWQFWSMSPVLGNSICSLNFEYPRLWYGFLLIILVLEKCNLGPWKSSISAWILYFEFAANPVLCCQLRQRGITVGKCRSSVVWTGAGWLSRCSQLRLCVPASSMEVWRGCWSLQRGPSGVPGCTPVSAGGNAFPRHVQRLAWCGGTDQQVPPNCCTGVNISCVHFIVFLIHQVSTC